MLRDGIRNINLKTTHTRIDSKILILILLIFQDRTCHGIQALLLLKIQLPIPPQMNHARVLVNGEEVRLGLGLNEVLESCILAIRIVGKGSEDGGSRGRGFRNSNGMYVIRESGWDVLDRLYDEENGLCRSFSRLVSSGHGQFVLSAFRPTEKRGI